MYQGSLSKNIQTAAVLVEQALAKADARTQTLRGNRIYVHMLCSQVIVALADPVVAFYRDTNAKNFYYTGIKLLSLRRKMH